MGLVLWSILKAGEQLEPLLNLSKPFKIVIGSFSGFHTDNETGIASYLEHPLDG